MNLREKLDFSASQQKLTFDVRKPTGKIVVANTSPQERVWPLLLRPEASCKVDFSASSEYYFFRPFGQTYLEPLIFHSVFILRVFLTYICIIIKGRHIFTKNTLIPFKTKFCRSKIESSYHFLVVLYLFFT